MSGPTADNVRRQGFVFAAVDGGLSQEEKNLAIYMAESFGLNSPENYNTDTDLNALLGGIDVGTVNVPDTGTGFSGQSIRKVKEALVIYNQLTYKVFSKKLLSAETQAEVGKPDQGMVMNAVKAGGGITPRLKEVVKSLGNKYLNVHDSAADLEALLKNERQLRDSLCAVAQIGCDTVAPPAPKIPATILFPQKEIPAPSGISTPPTPALKSEREIKPRFINLDKLATEFAHEIASKLKSKHLDYPDATKLHIAIAAVYNQNNSSEVKFFAGLLYDGNQAVLSSVKTFTIPAGYTKEDITNYENYLQKAVDSKPNDLTPHRKRWGIFDWGAPPLTT